MITCMVICLLLEMASHRGKEQETLSPFTELRGSHGEEELTPHWENVSSSIECLGTDPRCGRTAPNECAQCRKATRIQKTRPKKRKAGGPGGGLPSLWD